MPGGRIVGNTAQGRRSFGKFLSQKQKRREERKNKGKVKNIKARVQNEKRAEEKLHEERQARRLNGRANPSGGHGNRKDDRHSAHFAQIAAAQSKKRRRGEVDLNEEDDEEVEEEEDDEDNEGEEDMAAQLKNRKQDKRSIIVEDSNFMRMIKHNKLIPKDMGGWAVEDDEDKEIRYLERKLGLKSAKDISSGSKLAKEWEMDGLDFLADEIQDLAAESLRAKEKKLLKRQGEEVSDNDDDDVGMDVDDLEDDDEEDDNGEVIFEEVDESEHYDFKEPSSDEDDDTDYSALDAFLQRELGLDEDEVDGAEADDGKEEEQERKRRRLEKVNREYAEAEGKGEEEEGNDDAEEDDDAAANVERKRLHKLAKKEKKDKKEKKEKKSKKEKYAAHNADDDDTVGDDAASADKKGDIYGRDMPAPDRERVEALLGFGDPAAAKAGGATSTMIAGSAGVVKYVPPHLRKQMEGGGGSSAASSAPASSASVAGTTVSIQQSLAALTAASSASSQLSRIVNGYLNKLTVGNIEAIHKDFIALYERFSRADVADVLCNNIINTCVTPKTTQLLTAILQVNAALVTALHRTQGQQVGALFVERFVSRLNDCIQDVKRGTTGGKGSPVQLKDHMMRMARASNLLLFLVSLYSLNVVHSGLIFDMMTNCYTSNSKGTGATATKEKGEVEEEKEIPLDDANVEWLLIILQHCGYQLRKDDPRRLKVVFTEIDLATKKRAAIEAQQKTTAAAAVAGDEDVDSDDGDRGMRLKYMLDMVTDIRNSKHRVSKFAEVLEDMRTWLDTVLAKKTSAMSDRMLTVGWTDIMNIQTTGRWWLVGAAYKLNAPSTGHGHEDNVRTASSRGNGGKRGKGKSDHDRDGSNIDSDADGDDGDNLALLADAQRMNTDIRRTIFCVVMSSDDCMDCFEKVLKMNLSDQQERQVIRVVLHCCMQEKTYNPYYAGILQLLCKHSKNYRFTLQLALWDTFKLWDSNYAEHMGKQGSKAGTMPIPLSLSRQIVNAAKAVATLLSYSSLAMTVLKNFSFHSLTLPHQLFLHSLSQNLLAPSSTATDEVGVFRQLLPGAGGSQAAIMGLSASGKGGKGGLNGGKVTPAEAKRRKHMEEDISLIRDGLSFFLVRYFLPSLKKKVAEAAAARDVSRHGAASKTLQAARQVARLLQED